MNTPIVSPGTEGAKLGEAAPPQGSTGPAEFIPEKFRVMAGERMDLEASARKMAESYGHLQARLHSGQGDLTQVPDDYALTVPEALRETVEIDSDRLAEFKEQARSVGMTQGQFDMVMQRFLQVAPQLVEGALQNTASATIASLSRSWGTDYDKHLAGAMKAFDAFAGPDDKGRFDDILREPSIAYRILARIAPELGEAAGVLRGTEGTSGESIQQLLTSEAAGNPKHPDHKATRAKIDAYYASKYGNAPARE